MQNVNNTCQHLTRIAGYLSGAIISAILITACSAGGTTNDQKSWVGDYTFEEVPVKSVAGYDMLMQWHATIKEEADSLTGIVEINGQQTYMKLLSGVSQKNDILTLTYKELLDGNNEGLSAGDSLFQFIRRDSTIRTRWLKMQPRLRDNQNAECNCFK